MQGKAAGSMWDDNYNHSDFFFFQIITLNLLPKMDFIELWLKVLQTWRLA